MEQLMTLSRSEEPGSLARMMRPVAVDAATLWNDRLAEYRRLRAISDATPDDDGATDAYCAAMDVLLDATPAPNGEALAVKLQLIGERYEGFELPEETRKQLIADAEALSRSSVPPHAVAAGEPWMPSEPQRLWNSRRLEYVRLKVAYDALPTGSAGIEQAGEEYFHALHLLLDETPAPNREALLFKIQLAAELYEGVVCMEDETLMRLIVDAEAVDENHICQLIADAFPVDTTPSRHDWDGAVEAWEKATAYARAGEAADADDVEERWTAVTCRLDHVLRMPAPDAEAAAWKLVQLFGEDVADPEQTRCGSYGMAWFAPFYRDALRFLRHP